jgi:hypothetical protein
VRERERERDRERKRVGEQQTAKYKRRNQKQVDRNEKTEKDSHRDGKEEAVRDMMRHEVLMGQAEKTLLPRQGTVGVCEFTLRAEWHELVRQSV